ncbi:MAG: rhodanese-like domain-containing protein [Bacteroidia bacterium]
MPSSRPCSRKRAWNDPEALATGSTTAYPRSSWTRGRSRVRSQSPARRHLRGLRRVRPKAVRELDKARSVVVYCSVGYRNERIGEQLLAQGFSKVWNLYGGIFEWVNEGHEVVDAHGQPTDRVHTYNAD